MTPEERNRIVDALPDDMVIRDTDDPAQDPEELMWSAWRTALGHWPVPGHGHCGVCGPAVTCLLLAFREALTASVVRELDGLGALSPLGGEGCPHGDTWFDRVMCEEPCGSMHTYCLWCGLALEPPCPLGDRYPDVRTSDQV